MPSAEFPRIKIRPSNAGSLVRDELGTFFEDVQKPAVTSR